MAFCQTLAVLSMGVLSTGSIPVGLGSRFTSEDTLTYKRIKHVMSPYRIFKTFGINSKRRLRRPVIGDLRIFQYDRILFLHSAYEGRYFHFLPTDEKTEA